MKNKKKANFVKRKLFSTAVVAVGMCMAVSASDVVPPDMGHSFASRRHQGIPSIAASLVNGRLWGVGEELGRVGEGLTPLVE